jgi:hypothetical protein
MALDVDFISLKVRFVETASIRSRVTADFLSSRQSHEGAQVNSLRAGVADDVIRWMSYSKPVESLC